MPKNAVQRLQKIENDIHTVISIYDVANKNNDNEKQQIPQKSRPWAPFAKSRSDKGLDSSTIFDELKNESERYKSSVQNSRQSNDNNLELMRKYWSAKKPGSAPSSSSTLSTICESDPTWLQHSKTEPEKIYLPKARTLDDINGSDWYEASNSPGVYDVLMSPSRTLETANTILSKNNYKFDEDDEKCYQPGEEVSLKKIDAECKCKRECRKDGHSPVKNNSDKKTASVKSLSPPKDEKSKVKPTETRIPIQNKSNFSSPLKKTDEKQFPERQNPLISKSFSYSKTSPELKKDKSTSEISPTRHLIPEKIPRLEKHRIGSPERSKNAAKLKTDVKEWKEKYFGHWNCSQNPEEEGSAKERSTSEKKSRVRGASRDNSGLKTENKSKNIFKGKVETKDGVEKAEKCKNLAESTHKVVSVAQKTSKIGDELGPYELFKIIEKSNEKLEKMKVSKELALDIAKELKDKYEEVQQSKEELIERLHRAEEESERLNSEVKDVHQSNVKLQLKLEDIRKESQTKLVEQDARSRIIMDENIWLKSKISDMEKQHTEELLEKQKMIESIYRERSTENENESKRRGIQTEEEVRRLTYENSELSEKIEELRALLQDRHSKVESLEEKIRQLQEEVQKQKQHLKQKTDRLEETNKELDTIRENSKELEEQVKYLRTNIENFDQMHQTLVKQKGDCEQQLKSKEEEIRKLREENGKLKTELENETDSLLIKNKIIEDKEATIKQLRDKAEEAKAMQKRNQSLERILSIEREEKMELQEAVERLKWRKDDLKKKIKSLEGDLLMAPQEVVKDLQKTQIVLHELENQVQIKQKEWEFHLQSLIREKEQACSVAEFATKKLMQTTNEFQKQSEAHKMLHRVLAENLAEKERHLREAAEKVSHMQFTEKNPEMRKITRMADRYQRLEDMDFYHRRTSSCFSEHHQNVDRFE